MKIVVVGDLILDKYMHCKAVRLCPEAPAPVLHVERETMTDGGAGLVRANLEALFGTSIEHVYGSLSYKTRVFADRTLICRVDHDSLTVSKPDKFIEAIREAAPSTDAFVVSDYGKGAMTREAAEAIIACGNPVFVDAKQDHGWYDGAFCMFPNEHEPLVSIPKHCVRKLGARGCEVDDEHVPTEPQLVYDVTGAGDVFLAAFVWSYFSWFSQEGSAGIPRCANLIASAKLANAAAGISVRYVGTHIVTKEELFAESTVTA